MPNFPNARNYREWTCGPGGWGQGWPGRQVDVCAVPCVKQLVGTCFTAQEAQLGALWWHRYVEWEVPDSGREVQAGEDVFTHVADSLVVQQELRQHFKATSPQIKARNQTEFTVGKNKSSNSQWQIISFYYVVDSGCSEIRSQEVGRWWHA